MYSLMGLRLVSITKKLIKSSSFSSKSPQQQQKGHLAVYVGLGHDKTRHVVPLSYLNHRLFQDLLSRAEEENGFHHPMGGLTIPCDECLFLDLISKLS